jgi:signal transduction histidine kinase
LSSSWRQPAGEPVAELVTHEFRTSLTVVRGVARVLDRISTNPTADVLGATRELTAASRRMARAVENVLRVAEIEREEPHPEPVLIRLAVNSAVAKHQEEYPQCEPIILSPRQPSLCVDAVQEWLVHALINVLWVASVTSNRRLRIDWHAGPGNGLIRVGMTGRADESIPTGPQLGLIVAQQAVAAMGGELSIVPWGAADTAVELTLPLATP